MSGARIERRLAAILALDVSGYSQLMGADELGTLNALKGHRRERIDPAIARHNGRIVSIAGDGLMAEFASVVDAVAAAVAVQRAMLGFNAMIAPDRRIVLRIGINVGDIIFDGTDIFGEGVNVAARLEALCEPGGICISRSANEQVRDRLSLPFADLGEQPVKNIARAVGIHGLSAEVIAAMPADVLPAPSPAVAPVHALARIPFAIRLVAVLIIAAGALGAGWYLGMPRQPTQTTAEPARPLPPPQDRRGAIIVLPIEGASGPLARLARDIAERLANERGWPVVPPATAARYQGRKDPPATIGREQNVHFVATAALAATGRLTVTLYDMHPGLDPWTGSYDQPDADLIAAELHQAIIDAEVARARREHAGTLDATDAFLAANESPLLPLTRPNLDTRIDLLDRTLKADPGHRLALPLAARLRALRVLNGWSPDAPTDLAFALTATETLLRSTPTDVYQLRTRAYVQRATGQFDAALTTNAEVVRLNPNIPDTHREIGVIRQTQGDHNAALASFRTARALTGPDYVLDTLIASAALAVGDFDQSDRRARDAINEAPAGGIDVPMLIQIAAHSLKGEIGDARAELERYLAAPTAIRSIAGAQRLPLLQTLPNLVEGLRLAGLPEP